tara:strand:- start:633 stop:833 length:201 start_codon:yes stop_codon:yes gene_type:complete
MRKLWKWFRRLIRRVDVEDIMEIIAFIDIVRGAGLEIGQAEEFEGFRTKLGSGYYKIGPIPVERIK